MAFRTDTFIFQTLILIHPMTVEHVLVIPTPVFHKVGHFQGFCDDIDKYLEVILDPQHASYRPRPEMEQDPTFKQLIPYCVFRCDGEVFYYQRGTAQGEARLQFEEPGRGRGGMDRNFRNFLNDLTTAV